MLRRLDHWVGKNMFHPPTIFICQRLGCTQYSFSRWAWVVAVFWQVLMAALRQDWFQFAFQSFFFMVFMHMALSRGSNTPTVSFVGFRIIVGIVTILFLIVIPTVLRTHVYDITILFAEYASTITTIPPREIRQGGLVRVRVGARK